jgi:YbgC/YbaW family acyl-CoA thioester hydrolase
VTRFRDPLPEGARTFTTRVRVQWADIDIAGIMYFSAYWRYVERAEMEFFRELGLPYDRIFDQFDIWLARVHAEADYHAPALMDDWLNLRTHIERVGASSLTWKTVVFNERTGEAGGVFTLSAACMDRESKKSRPLPEAIRNALLTAVERQPAGRE